MTQRRAKAAIEDDRISGKIYDWPLLRRLLGYTRSYWLWMILAVVMIIVAAFLETLGPYLIKVAVDDYIIPGEFQGLQLVVLVYLGVLLGNFIIRYFQILLTQYIGQRIIYDVRNQIFEHLQGLHQQYFDRNPVGRLMTRVTSDVEALNQMFTQGLVMIFGDIFLIFGIVAMMITINLELALWTLSVIPLLFIVSFIFRQKVRGAYGQIRFYLARINTYLQERISGMSIVQLFNRERHDFQSFKDINWAHAEAFIKTIFYYAIFYPAVEIISAVALALIIFRGGVLISVETVTLGALIAFLQYAKMFFRPISDLSEKYNVLQAALASSERIFKLLDTKPLIVSPDGSDARNQRGGEIEFRNVHFSYTEEPVLRDVSFRIPAGEKYGFVGHTGAGKTTLLRLLGRFYDVQQGHILVDGMEVRQWPLKSLRGKMAIVLQDAFLFSGTIMENIRLGREDISAEAVEEAAEMVNAHRFISRMKNGYHASIRERGTNLSAGQRQLISLARALVMDPDILLLDEATANIDSEAESLIQEALDVVLRNRTAMVIAHRLSTIQRMDQIVVLHRGCLREQGTHQELLKKRGLYYKLYQLQYQEAPLS